MISRESSPPPLRCIPWFWQFFGVDFVLVLSTAVLVIVIDVSIIRRNRLGDTIEFHRHPSQHRHDPPGPNLVQCPEIEHDL
jgi:hypothetical protein